MVTRAVRVIACMALLGLGAVSYAQESRSFMGIGLDPTPLPELLTKHLGLKPGQGIRILNVKASGPADKVGLDRDDIIVAFQGEDTKDMDEFVRTVQQLPVHTRVTLEVIHLGQRKTVEFELEPMNEDLPWKYPFEPEIVSSWRPGRMFRLGQDGQTWIEIPVDAGSDVDLDVKNFFRERHVFHRVTDGEDYTITIEGDPNDSNSQIIIESGDTKHSTTLGKIDDLPEKYRAAAKESVESAEKASSSKWRLGKIPLPEPPKPDVYRRYFENITLPKFDTDQWSEKRDRMIEKLQEQVEKLKQRLEQMEKDLDKRADALGPKDPNSPTSGASEPSGETASPDDQAI
jgi:hypothetical protein